MELSQLQHSRNGNFPELQRSSSRASVELQTSSSWRLSSFQSPFWSSKASRRRLIPRDVHPVRLPDYYR